jgi:hypothetical protein
VATDEGSLLNLSDADKGDDAGSKGTGDKRQCRRRAKKRPVHFGDLSPKESTFPRSGQVNSTNSSHLLSTVRKWRI